MLRPNRIFRLSGGMPAAWRSWRTVSVDTPVIRAISFFRLRRDAGRMGADEAFLVSIHDNIIAQLFWPNKLGK
jgi:hypothetical protein